MRKSFKKGIASAASVLLTGSALVAPLANVVSAEAPKAKVQLEPKVEHGGDAIEGGTLKYALVGDGFGGLLSYLLYENSSDESIITWFNPSLFGFDENYYYDESGFAKLDIDVEGKKATITIPKDQKWDDGEPITIDDVIFPYYVIGHKDYTGVRYGDDFKNVVGMEDYHNGKSEEISGLNRVDDYTLEISYNEMNNSMLRAGGGICNFIEPKHVLKDIPVADLQDSDAVRSKPVGFGPFKVTQVVPGESVTLEANENYYKGRPKIDKVVIEVVSPSTVIQEMNNGNYDIAELPSDQYDTYKDAENYSILGNVANVYTYIGFKMGSAKDGVNVMDESRIVTNKALRQAMAYAIDNDAVGEKFYQGLRFRANSPITPNFTEIYDSELEGYKYDLEKAKSILAEAGFKDTNGDGYVEDPDGNEFVLDFASMSAGEVAEALSQYYIDAWGQAGIHVQLLNGRLMEMNAFYDTLKADDLDVDVYQGAWVIGGNPNQQGFFGKEAAFNYGRFTSPELEELFAKLNSNESFDEAYRVQAYKDWQAYMMEELPILPTLFRTGIVAVNKRVSAFDTTVGNDLDWDQIYLTAEEPVK